MVQCPYDGTPLQFMPTKTHGVGTAREDVVDGIAYCGLCHHVFASGELKDIYENVGFALQNSDLRINSQKSWYSINAEAEERRGDE